MKKITLLLIAFAVSFCSFAQCPEGSTGQWPSGTSTVNNTGVFMNISTCNYTSDYSVTDGFIIGDEYQIEIADDGVSKYVTAVDATNTAVVLGFGPSPLIWVATATDVQFNWSDDSACGGTSACHTSRVRNNTAFADTCIDPTSLLASNMTDITADLNWTSGGSPGEVDFNVEVYLTGESAAGGNTPVFANANVTGTMVAVTGLMESTDYDAYVTAACSGATANSGLVGPTAFSTTASCADVSGIMVSNITNSGADITWTAGTGNDSALVEVYNVGESAAGGNTAVYSNPTATGMTDTASGLAANSKYDVYVTGQCGTTATVVQGPIGFSTLCDPIVAPYSEDFESFGTGSTSFVGENCWTATEVGPYFWKLVDTNDTSSGSTGPGAGVSDGNYLFSEATSGSPGDAIELYSPLVDLSALSAPSLRFSYHMYGADMGTLEVLVNGTTEFTISGEQHGESDPFTEAFVDLSAYATQTVAVTFRAIRGAGFTSDMAVDSIIFDEAPSCFSPTSLAVSNITDVSADLSWALGGSEPEWEYALLLASDTAPVSGTTTMAMTYAASGLTSETDYIFYVRANCSATDMSDWSQVAFTTLVVQPTCASGIFLDSGGVTADYSTNEDITYTITPDTTGDVISVTFTYFSTENNGATACWDGLTIYDGPDSSILTPVISPPNAGGGTEDMWCWDRDEATPSGTGDLQGMTITSTHASGALTFVFSSDGSVTREGWEATVACAPLSTVNFEKGSLFSYYPNPVTNTLKLNAQKEITNVAVFNMLGQQVIKTAPNAVSNEVDMSALQSGAYFVKVTVLGVTETIRVIKN